jgi:hypothetical protein
MSLLTIFWIIAGGLALIGLIFLLIGKLSKDDDSIFTALGILVLVLAFIIAVVCANFSEKLWFINKLKE